MVAMARQEKIAVGVSAAILLAAAHTAEHRRVGFRVTGCRPSILRVFDITGVTEALVGSR